MGSTALMLGCGPGPDSTYRGLSSQHLPVALRLSDDDRRLGLDIRWASPCADDDSFGGVQRTQTQVTVPVAADGSFRWSGRHRFVLVGDDSDVFVPVRLTGRVQDGSITGRWSTGQEPSAYADCDAVDTRFRLREGGALRLPGPRAIGPGTRVTPLGEDGKAVAVGAGHIWVIGDTLSKGIRGLPRQAVAQIDPVSGRMVGRAAVRGGTLGAGAGAGWAVGYEKRPVAGSRKGLGRPAITRIDPRTHAARAVPVRPAWKDFRPMVWGLVVTRRSLWILNGQRIQRVDARTGRVAQTIRFPRGPRCRGLRAGKRDFGVLIAAGAGSVWAITEESTHCGGRQPQRLLRIDPNTGRVARTVRLRFRYDQLAVGSGGVWASVRVGDRQVLHRIDTRDGRPDATIPTGPFITSLAVRGDSVWIVAGDQLLRASARDSGATVIRRLRGPGSTVAVDRHGVWVVDRGARELIRVTPAR